MNFAKTIIGPSDSKLFKDVADILRYTDINAICCDAEMKEFLEVAKEERAKFIFYPAEAPNSDMVPIYSAKFPSEPIVMFIAQEETDVKRIKQFDRARVLHLPANPENVASMLRYFLRDRKILRERDRKMMLSGRIALVLLNGCITPDTKGFHFIRDAIEIILQDDCPTSGLRNTVYSEIAKKRKTTIDAIDHSIRVSVKNSWSQSGYRFKEDYFGVWGINTEKAPTPKEFMLTIAEGLKRDLANDLII